MATSVIDNKEQKLLRLEKADGGLLSRRMYNVVIGLVLAVGLALNAAMAAFLPASVYLFMYQHPIILVIGFLVVSFGAMFIIYKSDNPGVSFAGFILLSLAFGFLVASVVSAYSSATVTRAFMLTMIITLGMVVLASIMPSVFAKMGTALFAILLITLIAEVLTIIFTGGDPVIFDIVFVIVFALYIGYDWQKAQAYPPTLDNAVDSAADIYVDIINLFVRLLAILGRKE